MASRWPQLEQAPVNQHRGNALVVFSYPAFRRQTLFQLKSNIIYDRALPGSGAQRSIAPPWHRPSPSHPQHLCVGLRCPRRHGGERVQPRTAVVAFPQRRFPRLYTIISKMCVLLFLPLQRSGSVPFPKGGGTSPPGPRPGGAARKETGLSPKLQPCSNACADGFLHRVLLAPPGDLPAAGPRGTSPRPPRAPALCHARRGPSRGRACALRSRTAHRSFICDFQTSDSSVGATATSGLTDVRKSRHGAKVHEFWLGKTSRLGNLDHMGAPVRATASPEPGPGWSGHRRILRAVSIFSSLCTRRGTYIA